MTKQYMQFDAFKKLLLEAEKEDKKVYWRGGIGWGVTYDNWNINNTDTSKIGNAITGSLSYYIAILEDKNNKQHYDLLSNYFEYLTDGISRFVGPSLTWKDKTKTTAVENNYKYKDIYKLYEAKANFTIDITAVKDDPKEVKNRAKSIEWNAADQVAERVKQSGIYAQKKLFVNYASKTFESFEEMMLALNEVKDAHKNKTFKKSSTTKSTKPRKRLKSKTEDNGDKNLTEAIDFVKDLVERASDFGGYNQMLGNLKEMVNMSTGEFMKRYGNKDFFGALIVKGIMNVFQRKNSTTPQFKPSKYEIKGVTGTELKYQLPEAFGEPKEMKYSMEEPTEISSGVAFNSNDRVFKFTPPDEKKYQFTFYANNGAEIAGEFNLTVDAKSPKWKADFKELKFDMNDGGAKSIELGEYIENFEKGKLKVEVPEKQLSIGGNEVFIDNDTTLAISNMTDKINTKVNFKIVDKATNKEIDSKYIGFVIESKKRQV